MAGEAGFGVNFDAEFLKKLDEADKRLQKIADTSDKVLSVMKDLSKNGIGSVVKGLTQLDTRLKSMSKNGGVGSIGTQAAQSVDAINKMVEALARLTTIQQTRLQTQQAKLDYKTEANNIKELTIAERERARALERQDKANEAANKTKLAALTKEQTNNELELLNAQKRRERELIANDRKHLATYKQEALEIKRVTDEVDRLAKAYRNMPKKINQRDLNKLFTQSSNAKTINQHVTAIHNLKSAIRDLDTNHAKNKENLRRAKEEIARHEKELRKLGVTAGDVNNKYRGLFDITGQLQRRLALLFSVSQVIGYINKLITVRKEFELQQRALQAMLRDTPKANEIWNKTVELAVKSPFRVKELVTYTKQLSAYRIENDKLYETTKRLADVSAGLGVDMQRLIIAYGQVKAANYLRGTELRQFSEAGVNMLGELAEYFTQIEGRAVNVAEVFERISNRGVSFGDVEEVFKRLTSESGIFYEMQEKQSETLHGQISNLFDSIDLMLNEIGKSTDGILKGTVSLLRSIVDNWEAIALVAVPALQALISGWATYKVLSVANSANTIKFFSMLRSNLKASIILLTKGKKAMREFAIASDISSFGVWGTVIGAAASALLSLVAAIYDHSQALDEISKRYDEINEKVNKITSNLITAEFEKNIDKQKKELQKLIDIANKEYNLDININIHDLNEEEIRKKFNDVRDKIDEIGAFSFRVETLFQKDTEWTPFDDIQEDFEDLGRSFENARQAALLTKTQIDAYFDKYPERISQLNKVQKESLDIIKVGRGEKEDELEYIERLISAIKRFHIENMKAHNSLEGMSTLVDTSKGYNVAYYNFQREANRIGLDLFEWQEILVDYKEDLAEAEKEFSSFAENVKKEIENFPDEKKVIYLETAINKLASEKNWSNFVLQQVEKWSKKELGVTLNFRPKEPDKDTLESWQDSYNKLFGDNPVTPKFDPFYGFKEITDKNITQLDEIKRLKAEYERIKELIDKINEAGGKKATEKGGPFEGQNLDLLEERLSEIQTILSWFGARMKDTEKTGKDWMVEVIKSVKDAHNEYLSLIKTLDSAGAKQLSLAKYAKVFSEAAKNAGLEGISLGDLHFDSEQGAKDALYYLLDLLPETAKKTRFKIKEALSEIEGEVVVKTKVEEDKKIIDSIEDMFGNYEVSLELEKLNIPPDLAKRLFGVDAIDLSTIRKEIESKLAAARASGGQEDLVEKLEERLKKVEDLEDKSLRERLKKYSKYLATAMGERVKIKMEELRQIEEIENTSQLSSDQKELAKQGVKKESQAKMDKLSWEEFKDSGMYVQLFEDLEYASTRSLTVMREKLEQLKGSLKDLDADDLRNLYNQIEKIDEQLAKRNPFKTFATSIGDYINAVQNTKNLEKDLQTKQTAYDVTKGQEENLDIQLAKLRAEYEAKAKSKKLTDEESKAYIKNIESLEMQLRILRSLLDTRDKDVKKAQENLDTNSKTKKEFKEAAQEVGNYISQVSNAIPQLASDMENIFGEMDAGTRDTIESIAEIGSGIGSAIQGFASGDYVQGVLGVTQAISGIFKVGDKAKEREIQRQIELVDKLGKQYEKLEKQIDEAYSIDQLKGGMDAAKSNIEQQLAAYDNMIAAEEDKKKTDKSKIEEWKEAKEELTEQYEELQKEQIESMGGTYDYKSATREFVEAWIDAFNETGNGLDGLTKHFQEWWKDILVNQAVMKQASKIMQPLLDKVNESLEDYTIDDKEQKDVFALADTVKGDLDDYLKEFYEKFGSLFTGVDDSGLSGLQRGIQGITESQADILASYLNSIRFYVSENNSMLSQYLDYQSETNEIENPMLGELRVISKQTSAINTLLEEVRTRDRDTAFNVRVIP